MKEQCQTWQGFLSFAALLGLALLNPVQSEWAGLSVGTRAWTVCNCLSAALQWAYPAFVVVTGGIFFSGKQKWNVKFLLKKIVPAAFFSWIVWWLAAAAVDLQENFPQEMDFHTFGQCLGEVLSFPGCIGFCEMTVSMLILYPLLFELVQNRKLTLYAILLFYFMSFASPVLNEIPYLDRVALFTKQLNWGFFRSWSFYLLLGAYLVKYETDWKARLAVYCAAIAGTGLMAALTSRGTSTEAGFTDAFLGFSSPLTGVQAAAAAIAARQWIGSRNGLRFFRKARIFWYSAPALFVAGFFAKRFIGNFGTGGIWVAAEGLTTAGLAAGCTFFLIRIPFFRCLTGKFDGGE